MVVTASKVLKGSSIQIETLKKDCRDFRPLLIKFGERSMQIESINEYIVKPEKFSLFFRGLQ